MCGNGILEYEEECEGENLRGQSCVSLGMEGGELSCKPNCSFNLRSCTYSNLEERFVQRRLTAKGNGVCYTDAQGDSWCWGENSHSSGGVEPLRTIEAPTPILGDFRFSQISAGLMRTCGITTDGRLFCWGKGPNASFGPPTHPFSFNRFPFPAELDMGLDIAHIEVGCSLPSDLAEHSYSCALSTEGEISCWGSNYHSCIGAPETVALSATPIPILHDTAFVSVTAGGHHTCALDSNGETWCWGFGAKGQLGEVPAEGHSSVPLKVPGGHHFTQIAAGGGGGHTCGLDAAGVAYCWGRNDAGQLGVSRLSVPWSSTPLEVAGGHTFTTVGCGEGYSCGLTASQEVYCWGTNRDGRLGIGATEWEFSTSDPVRVSFDGTAVQLSVGALQACLVDAEGQMWCWGAGEYDEAAGWGSRPVQIGHIGEGSVVAGLFHLCAIGEDGRVSCWGTNSFGVSGRPNREEVLYKQRVSTSDGRPLVDLDLYIDGTFATDEAGQAWYWGSYHMEGLETDTATPVKLHEELSLRSVQHLNAENLSALDSNGRVVRFGYALSGPAHYPFGEEEPPFIQLLGNGALNVYGEVASTDSDDATAPGEYLDVAHTYKYLGRGGANVDLLGRVLTHCLLEEPPFSTSFILDSPLKFVQGECGREECCALDESHDLYCWSRRECSPTPVLKAQEVQTFTLGRKFGCLLTLDEEVLCWGENRSGQLGNGSFRDSEDLVAPVTFEQWAAMYL